MNKVSLPKLRIAIVVPGKHFFCLTMSIGVVALIGTSHGDMAAGGDGCWGRWLL